MTAVDLLTFLKARLDEDEAAARAAFSNQADPENGWGAEPRMHESGWVIVPHVGLAWEEVQAAHIARHDPARVLAEVAAKRAIVDMHHDVGPSVGYDPPGRPGDYGEHPTACSTCGVADEYAVPWPCGTIRALASVYASHPDCDEAWRS